ncbi:hypothetical protein F4780DRAFT_747793 [Xylariomycetidae sp. FL0641]|nr:hypothetical protein F4780DRAFT_747793 [Xylariomycetidae sp. FL0641]
MSLGIKSLWRTQQCTPRAKGFSLIPRESCARSLFPQPPTQRWLSQQSQDSSAPRGAQSALSGMKSAQSQDPEYASIDECMSGRSGSAYRRAAYRHIIHEKAKTVPSHRALVRPSRRFPSKFESRRSRRKHQFSVANQHVHDYVRWALSKPEHDLQSTLGFMLRHTPDLDKIHDFKVIIGTKVASQARKVLSSLDTSIDAIQERNQCIIRVEEDSHHHHGSLALSLSGSDISARKSVMEIVRLVGRITAIRVPDVNWTSGVARDLSTLEGRRRNVQVLSRGEKSSTPASQTIAVLREAVEKSVWNEDGNLRYSDYFLMKRADEITPPTEWTKASFEQYVAALVHGQIPRHLASALYPKGEQHQDVVGSLLLKVFKADETRFAVTVSAMKIALQYTIARGAAFRPISREIFHRAEVLQLPLDAPAFQMFLVGASRAGDLDGFNGILRTMVRKRFYVQGPAWRAFLEMIHDTKVKAYVIRKMRVKGLHRYGPILAMIGRQAMNAQLEEASHAFDVPTFVKSQDRRYGETWLDVLTMNKLLDTLGSHGRLDACVALLDLVFVSGRLKPDTYTLNTLITHSHGTLQKLQVLKSMMVRWPSLRADEVTYLQLYRRAWSQRMPNMLRVIWRYAALSGHASPKMVWSLTKLIKRQRLSNQVSLMKAWEDVIFGQEELQAMREQYGDDLTAGALRKKYTTDAPGQKPSIPLWMKLKEAYVMDKSVHSLFGSGEVLSKDVRLKHSVAIPLVPWAWKRPEGYKRAKRQTHMKRRPVRRVRLNTRKMRRRKWGWRVRRQRPGRILKRKFNVRRVQLDLTSVRRAPG